MKNLKQIPDNLKIYQAKKLRIGFSGGSDSTALLLLLLRWGFAPEQIECVHFDHGLRGKASSDDAAWCRDFCNSLKVKSTIVELDLLKKNISGSLEDAARNARLQWYLLHDDNSPVVLAHHADDADETLFLKLARGGNVSALSSLRFERKIGNLTLLRPLLPWRKSELEAFLREQNVYDWRHDASNESNSFHRNYLRNKLLKEWREYHAPLADGLQRSRQALALDAEFIESLAAEKLAGLGENLPRETPAEFWRSLHKALLARVLPGYLKNFCCDQSIVLTRTMLEHFQAAVNLPYSSEVRSIELGNGCFFEIKQDKLKLLEQKNERDLPDDINWNWRSEEAVTYGNWQIRSELLSGSHDVRGKGVFCFDAAAMPGTLQISPRRGGEQMQVWGSDKLRRVKHILTGNEQKNGIFLLKNEDGVIYLLGDLRRSIHAAVTEETAQTLKITVKELT